MKSHYLLISLLALNGCSHIRQANTTDLANLDGSTENDIGKVVTDMLVEKRHLKVKDTGSDVEFNMDLQAEPLDMRPIADYSVVPVSLRYLDTTGTDSLYVDVQFSGVDDCNATYWGLIYENKPFELILMNEGSCIFEGIKSEGVKNLVLSAFKKSLE